LAEIALWILQQVTQLFGTNRFDGRMFLDRIVLRYMDALFVVAFLGSPIESEEVIEKQFVTNGSDCVGTSKLPFDYFLLSFGLRDRWVKIIAYRGRPVSE